MKSRKKKPPVGAQFKTVMKEFGNKKLRTSHGEPVTKPAQAVAIASSEQRAATSRGTTKRTFMGRTRVRPKKKSRGE